MMTKGKLRSRDGMTPTATIAVGVMPLVAIGVLTASVRGLLDADARLAARALRVRR
jgi:hypothetical protein